MKTVPELRTSRNGSMITEIIIALAIVTTALLPLAYAYVREERLLRADCHRAVALQILDGEIEIIAAGAWRGLPEGTNVYAVNLPAAKRLPPSRFVATRQGEVCRLEWLPEKLIAGGPFLREVKVDSRRP